MIFNQSKLHTLKTNYGPKAVVNTGNNLTADENVLHMNMKTTHHFVSLNLKPYNTQ